MRTVSVIIPAYNEEATIEELLRRVEVADWGSWQKEIIVVDDGSRDRTREILSGYDGKPGYRIIFQKQNGGKGVAERAGIAAATGDYLVLQDADLEYDPREIRKLLEVVDMTGAPIVFGSRNLESHWHRVKSFFTISVGVWVSTHFVNLLYGTKLTDAWTCYKLFSREVSRRAQFIGSGFEADYLFIGDAAAAGYPIVEVAVSHVPRTVEEGKKIRYKDGFRSMWLLLSHRLLHLRNTEFGVEGKAERAAKIRPYLRCPQCGGDLDVRESELICRSGHRFGFSENNVPLLVESSSFELHHDEHVSGINWLKSFLKQFPGLYYALWHVFCPVLMVERGPKHLFKYVGPDPLVADVGSGPERIGPALINVDIFPFPGVDIVATADRLPIADGSLDAVVTESLLEHVTDPKAVAVELTRVLKPGGVVYTSIPFITPYHASPDDFQRLTTSGLRQLFAGFEVLELGVRSGPWSAFLVWLAYTLGVIFSLGSRRAAPFLAFIFMLVIGPFKILDPLVSRLPGAEAVSAQLYIIARKP